MTTTLSRREALKGTLSFACVVGGAEVWLTPREARAANVDFSVLHPHEALTLETLGEVLLPGARQAGIAHFVDHQLSVASADCLLMLRYMDVPPPYVDFYRPALAAVEATAMAAHGKSVGALEAPAAEALVTTLARENPPGWQGPPAPLFYFVARSDAVDVVYGTPEGFAQLGVPYMPHIMPAKKW